MGTQGNKTAEQPSPRKLLSAFSGGSIVFWILAAILIHAVFIGSLSTGYIRDQWIDPEGARIRKENMEKEEKLRKELLEKKRERIRKAAASNAMMQAIAASNALLKGSASTNSVTNSAAALLGVPDDRANSPVVRRATDKASTNEIPKESGLGIGIEDTNPRN